MRPTHQPLPSLLLALDVIRPERLRPEAARRFRCVWMRLALNLPAPEIAKVLALNPSTVRHIHSAFFRDGIAAILGHGQRGGRRRALMTLEQECAVLHNAAAGRRHLEIRRVSALLEEATGKPVDASTVRHLLKRHGWRKTMGLVGTWSREDEDKSGSHACWSMAG